MKTTILLTIALAASLGAVSAEEKKTLGEKAADTAEKAKEKTKAAGKAVADATKKAADKVVDAVTPDSDARKVDVTLSENHIAMPKSLAPGKTAFVVRNGGKHDHNFAVRGEGIDKKFFSDVAPGESKVLHVDLKAGSYTVTCPVKDHAEEGMKVALTVK